MRSCASPTASAARTSAHPAARWCLAMTHEGVGVPVLKCERAFWNVTKWQHQTISVGAQPRSSEVWENRCCRFRGGEDWVIPLHSTVAPEQQRRAFLRPPANVRKVVVATNIAETSLTIEDVVYVVDSGKLKERRYSAARGLSMLVLDHVSQARTACVSSSVLSFCSHLATLLSSGMQHCCPRADLSLA
jgi:Helicase conserved C-terminal domain